jgi:hypothetical protein
MNLQENIRRILKEETKLPSFIRRRFSEEDINELISDIEFAIPTYGGDEYIDDVIYDEVREFMMNKSEFGKGTLQDNLSNDEWLNQLYKFEEPLRDYVRSVFNMNLQEQTKKVLKEETNRINIILRRLPADKIEKMEEEFTSILNQASESFQDKFKYGTDPLIPTLFNFKILVLKSLMIMLEIKNYLPEDLAWPILYAHYVDRIESRYEEIKK